jgi:hypothetical protein
MLLVKSRLMVVDVPFDIPQNVSSAKSWSVLCITKSFTDMMALMTKPKEKGT